MRPMNLNEISSFIENNIGLFHNKRLQSLDKLKLDNILKRKNPYLFKAKNILTAQDLIKTFLDAHLSSQEETIFGGFLELLAIFINHQVYSGRKSAAEGIDMEFEKDDSTFLVSIKSGPHWGNSRQIAKMREDFKKAQRILRTSNSKLHIVAVNGCCYGRDNKPDKGDYYKYCGQKFWEFISSSENLYTEIIQPLGNNAKKRNDEFYQSYAQILNKFTIEFGNKFCTNGKINWEKLAKFNSSKSNPSRDAIEI